MVRNACIPAFGQMQAGQDLVLAGCIALWGTSRLASVGEERLKERFTPRFIRRCQEIYGSRRLSCSPECFGAASWCSPGEGGIMAALWDYLSHFGLGFEIDLKKLTVLQETIEVCEVFDVNPYRLHTGGCLLFTADNGGALARKLEREGIRASVAGWITGGVGRQIINGETHSFLDRPKPDELYKIDKQQI
ncbi:hypothetical protein [Otoolea muris]|uniref:hypothetical protein n=1 Tax=Otoolea muris TaxID=2941515 RepID=UPI00203EF547|nr:hypothetical protein [Otoolea muris]